MFEVDYEEAKTLSVVHIILAEHRERINALAEMFGCGKNSMNVELLDENKKVFFGCHSWWRESDYQMFTNSLLIQRDLPEFAQALEQLHERTASAQHYSQNWQSALAELGLVTVSSE